MENANFINEVLNSTKGMKKVVPGTDLFSKIEQRISVANTVSTATIWWVAASIAILMAVNFGVISSKSQATERQASSSLASELNQSNQLY